jgi:uncharacterized repeat protein (TIGR04138 family)
MLCVECQQREANVFLTQICDGETTSRQLCEICAGPIIQVAQAQAAQFGLGNLLANITEQATTQPHARLDSRFPQEAYQFVIRAVVAARSLAPSPDGHVSGPSVAEAFRRLALVEFGADALASLAAWGITSCEDIGSIVFHMVEHGVLGARPEDKPEDFHGLYDFPTAFPTNAGGL